jgi:DNA (cytosine-5)-methyltransferase 3A
MLKFLIGGSPCTHWSIAQSNNRETQPQGLGWELFSNFLRAKERFKPDYFLYENNKSAAKPIKEQISVELGVPLQYINSSLVSAQKRERFYAHNFGDVPQPEDRRILLKDILESGVDLSSKDKAYCFTATYGGAIPDNTLNKKQRSMVAEPICVNSKSGRGGVDNLQPSLSSRVYDIEGKHTAVTTCHHPKIAEPIRVGSINKGCQGERIYSSDGKSISVTANSGGIGQNTGLYAIPLNIAKDGKAQCLRASSYKDGIRNMVGNNVDKRTCVAIPADSKKAFINNKIYEVKDGFITMPNGNVYPIKLADGFYIIRKLTVSEACRLQTMPSDYCRAVSASQGYKGLGNGWTAEVIIHLLSHALKGIPKSEKIVVLSMYDGIGTGRYCFDKLGYNNIAYYAYEIDKYAIKVALSNYGDIIECGDAFDVRSDEWFLEHTMKLWEQF